MKIAIIVEGATENVFIHALREYLKLRIEQNQMPQLKAFPQGGRIPKEEKLKRLVENLLTIQKYDAVIAITDVYTGTNDFEDAADAKEKMRRWVGEGNKFYPHAAQHDFEAWLLPYWSIVQQVAGTKRNAPLGSPELVNHNKPPSKHLMEAFEVGTCRKSYDKRKHGKVILEKANYDLTVAADACPELKALLNTLLELSGGDCLS